MSTGVQFNINLGGASNNNAVISQLLGGLGAITNQLNTLNRNFVSGTQQINNNLQSLQSPLANTNNGLGNCVSKLLKFNQALEGVRNLKGFIDDTIGPGIKLNKSMADLSAISGVTGKGLDDIEKAARKSAKTFGGDASNNVESYKLLLSQLSPEIAKNVPAMQAMGDHVSILSKTMGGDTRAAAEVLTTAMNQYGISTKDPIAASKTMAEMMNIMAAGAKEGSAEMPQIKSALEQSGMMAKTANVSFLELNASIQVLDKSGKKGAEGGVAIRNALAEMSQGALNSPKTIQMLKDSGISIDGLADKSKTFAQRLALLKPIAGDTAKMTQLFGKENVSAGIALVNNTDEINRLSGAMKGTNTATEQAKIVMASYEERMKRAKAWTDDLKISVFNATSGFMPFLMIGLDVTEGIGKMAGGINSVVTLYETAFPNGIGKAASSMLNFAKNTAIATWGLVKQAAQMAWNAILTVGGFVGGLIAATAAQIGLNIAMSANPIGLIVIGIAAAIAAIALLIYYWDEIWAAIKSFGAWVWEHSPFKFLIDIVDKIFPGFKDAMTHLWEWVKKKFTDLINWFKDVWKSIKGVFSFGSDDSKPASKEEAAAMEDAVTKGVSEAEINLNLNNKKQPLDPTNKDNKKASAMASNVSSGGGGNSGPKIVNITIQKLIGIGEVRMGTIKESAKEAGNQVVEKLLESLYSVNTKI